MNRAVSFLPVPVDDMLRKCQTQNFPVSWSLENNGKTVYLKLSWNLEDQRYHSRQSSKSRTPARKSKKRSKQRLKVFLERKVEKESEKVKESETLSSKNLTNSGLKPTGSHRDVFKLQKPCSDISVRNPQTHSTGKGKYTSYEIAVQTTDSAFCLPKSSTRRRYSEFEWLRKKLRDHHPLLKPPDLPPTSLFSNFGQEFISFRMQGLQSFLIELMKEMLYFSDTAFHLFIQTDLSCEEIDSYLLGEISEDYIKKIWQAGGKKEINSKPTEITEPEDSESDKKNIGNPLITKASESSSKIYHDEQSPSTVQTVEQKSSSSESNKMKKSVQQSLSESLCDSISEEQVKHCNKPDQHLPESSQHTEPIEDIPWTIITESDIAGFQCKDMKEQEMVIPGQFSINSVEYLSE